MQKQFDKVMDIGEQLLVCGAEVHRVEESIERMCSALGFIKTDVFIITSSIVVTVHTSERTYTQTRRIKATGMDVEKIHKLNGLSRKICEHKLSEEEFNLEMESINQTKHPPEWLKCLSYIMIAGVFTTFFGGSFTESCWAAIIGATLYIVTHFLKKTLLNKMFVNFIGSFVISLGAYLFMKFGLINVMDNVIIGNIMLLIPGVAITDASRDLLIGDSISGSLRLVEAVLTALAIAAGYFLFMFFVGGIIA